MVYIDSIGRPEKRKIVMKIGGSVLTYKQAKEFPMDIYEIKLNANHYIRNDFLSSAAKQIREALDTDTLELILINGVGPFGHYLVKHGAPHQTIRESVRYLNEHLTSYLEDAEIDSVTIVPSETCYFREGRYDVSRLWEETKKFMKKGNLVTSYGDVLPDGTVISGDDLVTLIAELWEADKIITVTDVEGLYTGNPKLSSEIKLIRCINSSDGVVKLGVDYDSDTIDVTGGFEGKVDKLIETAKKGIKGQMINGLKEGNIKRALLGDESIGTIIVP